MSSPSPGNEYVSDTMALIKRIAGQPLGSAATAAFDVAEAGHGVVALPAMVFAEILYLSEKTRISITLVDVANYLRRFPNCKEQPMTLAVVEATAQIDDIPDLHDRLIAGTARALNRPLITNDPAIQASAWLTTVW